MSNNKDPFVSIDASDLQQVAGGAARVASSGGSGSMNDQLMLMLTEIGNSIKELGKNNGGGGDMMTMMMMMMMMGGFGGGGGGGGGFAAAPLPPPIPNYIDVGVAGGGYYGGGGCGRGKKGW